MIRTLLLIKNRIKAGLLKEIWASTKWVYEYAKHYTPYILIYTLIGLVGTGFMLVSSLISKDLVDIITGHKSSELIKTFCLFIGFSIGSIFITQISTYISSWINIKVDNEIKSDIFHKILITDWESISSYHTGDLMVRWNSDVSTISNGILNWIPNLIIYFIRFISSLIVITYYDPTFTLISLLGIPFGILMSRTIMKSMHSNNKESAAMNAKMSSLNQEVFSNIQTIKAFHLINTYTDKLRRFQNDYLTMRLSFQRLSMKTSILMSLIGIAISYGCYAWGIYRVWTGAITYGTMTLFLALSANMTGTLNSLISLVPTSISISTSASRLMDILRMPKEDFSEEAKVLEFHQNHRKEGISVLLQNFDYSYQNGTKVFEHSSIEAHPHEIIALVGPSGEGKTTLLRILLSLLHPQNGTCLLYGGLDPKQSIPISPSTRKLFSYVPQGNTMFSGTIAENMRSVKPDATEEEMIHALDAACAMEFIQRLPDGINNKIGERGGGFSEGQAQRLSIARALLRKSPILLLDEATSALDVATERRVLRNIMRNEYPRTCIITTHRPSVLELCNKTYAITDQSCHLLTIEEIQKLGQNY